jgi:hypothetical protein
MKTKVIPSDMFTWHKGGKTFTADAAMLEAMQFDFGRGFTMQSVRTGRTIGFSLARELRDKSGELYGWLYRCMNLPSVSATIFND